jgi:FtsP/CotA-like multicopper oxidase with cupredoxin domain
MADWDCSGGTSQRRTGLIKDGVALGGYQEADIDFGADNPGPALYHCHQQLHMDFGFMALFDYVRSG